MVVSCWPSQKVYLHSLCHPISTQHCKSILMRQFHLDKTFILANLYHDCVCLCCPIDSSTACYVYSVRCIRIYTTVQEQGHQCIGHVGSNQLHCSFASWVHQFSQRYLQCISSTTSDCGAEFKCDRCVHGWSLWSISHYVDFAAILLLPTATLHRRGNSTIHNSRVVSIELSQIS